MDVSDHVLLDRYRQGEVDALATLVEKYKRQLYGYILNMTEGREDADEVFQEVWFRVIRKIDLYKKRNFLGWVVRIARNLIIDRARRRKPGMSLDAELDDGRSPRDMIAGKGIDPLNQLADNDLGGRIKDAVATLPPEQKEVFVMRMTAGLPFKEIAKMQKVSINTALARMQYALTKLRPLLQEEYDSLSRGSGTDGSGR